MGRGLQGRGSSKARGQRGRNVVTQVGRQEVPALTVAPADVGGRARGKIVLFANTDWYLYNFRLSLARALAREGYEVLLISPPGRFGPMLQELGFRWQPVAMTRRSLNAVAEFALVLHLARLFRRENADLVHGFTIKPAFYGSLAARLAGVKARIVAVTGLGYVFISGGLWARLLRIPLRWLSRRAMGGVGARLIVQNETDLRYFVNGALVTRDHARLIQGSGVDCARFHPRREARTPGPLRVLLAARLLWDKGIGEFVQAAQCLRAGGRDIHFILAGEPDPGNPASIPPSTVRSWVAAGILRWVGYVDDMPALMREVDVVVLPSYREGLSKSLIEAAACGKAVITTDTPGCRDVVTHGREGLLIPVREWEPLAAAIGKLDDDRDLVRTLGEAARVRAVSEFEETIVIARTLEVYSELLTSPAD
jgi:glycosyltransferase involved in cell wall biosynthesis